MLDFLQWNLSDVSHASGPWMTRIDPPDQLGDEVRRWVISTDAELALCLAVLDESVNAEITSWIALRANSSTFLDSARSRGDYTAIAVLLSGIGPSDELTNAAELSGRGEAFASFVEARAATAGRKGRKNTHGLRSSRPVHHDTAGQSTTSALLCAGTVQARSVARQRQRTAYHLSPQVLSRCSSVASALVDGTQ